MIVKGTYFQNSEKNPLVYGDVEIHNIPRRRLRGEEEKHGGDDHRTRDAVDGEFAETAHERDDAR